MLNAFKGAILALAVAAPGIANAATVAFGSTQADESGGIVSDSTPSYAATNPNIFGTPLLTLDQTTPPSAWVWAGPDNFLGIETRTFSFSFNMAGYNVATANLFGSWAADDFGTVSLNGVEIGSLPAGQINFQSLSSYGTADSNLFNAGLNTLSFEMTDIVGTGGFRATVIVDAAVVPLPASAPLILVALGGLALVGRRRSA